MECEFLGQRLIAKYFTRALMGLIYQQPQRAARIEKAAASSEGGGERRFLHSEHVTNLSYGENACCVSLFLRPLPTCFDPQTQPHISLKTPASSTEEMVECGLTFFFSVFDMDPFTGIHLKLKSLFMIFSTHFSAVHETGGAKRNQILILTATV
jgi:hypothetical protein